jgi:putative ABC transport system substrate-binding protein
MANELDIKRVQILGEVLSADASIAVIDIPDVTEDYLVQKMRAMNQALGGKPGRIVRFVVPTVDELDTTFERIAQQRISAVSVNETPFATENAPRIAALIAKYKLAAIAFGRSFSKVDVLMTYSADFDAVRHAAESIGKIVKGANPAEMPIVQPTQFRFVVNLRVAKSLGIKLPSAVLARADELIE